jgi:two-component system, OmpR family, phosphate regulon sensor histidine kinase PhoR
VKRQRIGIDELLAVVDRLPDGIVAVDRDVNVGYVNRAAERFFHPRRVRIGEALPAAWFDVDLLSFAKALFESRLPTVTREVRFEEETVSLIGIPPGHGSLAVLVIEDVSGRARRDRARNEFVANAAHELLTPLTGIIGAAHVLESGAKEDPLIRDRFLGHISRECSRLVRIARGLLVLARARSGEEPPRPEIVALRGLLDDVIAGADGGGVDVHCPADVAVFVDRDLAEQALTNLVANAQRHSGDGAVAIFVDERGNGSIGIEIVDTGVGLTPEQLERLGRRFASGGGRDGGGFGLGVSIASQALETIGGKLDLTSEPGKGTRARAELPAARS